MYNVGGYPRPLPAFAAPNQILENDRDGCYAFHCFYNFVGGKYIDRSGTILKKAARDVLIAGAEYYWQKEPDGYLRKSIIWRTGKDEDSMKGGSGGVVCLGRQSADTCKAAIFQSYETQTLAQDGFLKLDWRRHLTIDAKTTTYTGGFLLPKDIQNAMIRVAAIPSVQPRWSSGPVRPFPDPPEITSDRDSKEESGAPTPTKSFVDKVFGSWPLRRR